MQTKSIYFVVDYQGSSGFSYNTILIVKKQQVVLNTFYPEVVDLDESLRSSTAIKSGSESESPKGAYSECFVRVCF